MSSPATIHTNRTMMFAELSRIMFNGIGHGSFETSFSDNVAGKLSRGNQNHTNRLLKKLYGFDPSDPFFRSFIYFWENSNEGQLPAVTLIMAFRSDILLAESIDPVINTPIGHKVSVDLLEKNIVQLHPDQYSTATLRSLAQNIASSWKQTGFILGKVKNIRVQPEIDYRTVAFSLLMGYLEGLRGEFLMGSKYIRALGLPDTKVRELIAEAAKRDILQYQYSGHVTTILFPTLLKSIGIYGE